MCGAAVAYQRRPKAIDLVPYFHSLIHTPRKGGPFSRPARTTGSTFNPTRRPVLVPKILESTPCALTVVGGHHLEFVAEMYEVSPRC